MLPPQTFSYIRKREGGGSAGAAAGALGAAGLDTMESAALRTVMLQGPVWTYLKICMSMIVPGMIAAWVLYVCRLAGGVSYYQRRVVRGLGDSHVIRSGNRLR